MNTSRFPIAMLLVAIFALAVFGQQPGSTQDKSNEPNSKAKPSAANGVPASQEVPLSDQVLEFPIEGSSIDAEAFYQTVLAKMHWSTELTEKIAGELKQTNAIPQIESPGRISLEALGILTSLFPTAFEVVPVEANKAESPAAFRVNLGELESKWSDQKLSLRNWLSSKSQRPLYEVCGRAGFDGQTERAHVVIVLPGLHGGDGTACNVAAAIHQRTGLAACAFRYPNDAPLDESTDYLIRVLKQWQIEWPKRTITLVTHSMGGLVARNAIERKMLGDPRCLGIERLVLICPPNQGSVFAEYAGVLEGAEQLQRLFNRGTGRKLFSAVLDGFNEAPTDLVPGSEFIKQLDAAKRHPQVKYSILAGDAGLLDPVVAQLGNELLEVLARRVQSTKPLQDRARNLINSDELKKGTGDGVVTLQSAQLEGVKDFEVLPINHLEWGELDKPAGQRVLDEITERLTKRTLSF